jgi:EVE domain
MLRTMARGDWIVFYSPKTAYPDGAPLQAFTAIGQVADGAVRRYCQPSGSTRKTAQRPASAANSSGVPCFTSPALFTNRTAAGTSVG